MKVFLATLILLPCWVIAQPSYYSILRDPHIAELRLTYNLAYAESGQKDVGNPLALPGPDKALPDDHVRKNVSIRMTEGHLSIAVEYVGEPRTPGEKAILRNAVSRRNEGMDGTPISTEQSSPAERMNLFGQLFAGQWLPPLPTADGRLERQFFLPALPMEGLEQETAPGQFAAKYAVKRDKELTVNGQECIAYSYEIAGTHEEYLGRNDRKVSSAAQAIEKLVQELSIQGRIAVARDSGVVFFRTEQLEYMTGFLRRKEGGWKATAPTDTKTSRLTTVLSAMEIRFVPGVP